VRTGAIYRGVVPFIVLQLLMLAVLMAWPALATWLPSVLYR
jgi:TRAP-type mannitol/chloroaromatic compound transport system permease large subunit